MTTRASQGITTKLRELFEEEFDKYGFVGNTGKRHLALSPSIKVMARDLNVSEGTIKNAILALKDQGYIEKQQPGMYFVLSNGAQLSSKAPEAASEEDELEWDGESKRLALNELEAVLRDLLITCDRETAIRFIVSHRAWCWLNGLTPHI